MQNFQIIQTYNHRDTLDFVTNFNIFLELIYTLNIKAMSENNTKIFVLDTNVILHDFKSIFHFEEHDVVIPITVLEELDKFKKGNDLINFHAREFMRDLDKLSGERLFSDGVSLGNGRGRLFLETGKPFTPEMLESFAEKTADHRILAVAVYYKNKFPDMETCLVTQDINLRMKAKSLGMMSEDYQTNKVESTKEITRGFNTHENIDDKLISSLFQSEKGVPSASFNLNPHPAPNDYFILKGNNSSALGTFSADEKVIKRVNKLTAYGIKARNSEQTFALDALLNPDIKLVSVTGKAGTGKTLLALASALQQRRDFEQILLARPLVALSNSDLGYLPGDEKAKIGPYMQPLFDNLNVIKQQYSRESKNFARIEDMQKDEKLLITPLAYIRGRSLSKVFFIVDEAQNLTPHEIKTIITRAGEGTKMVFTGDINQIDSPYLDKKSNGLTYLTDKMQGQSIFSHINLSKGERSFLSDLASDLL